MPSEVMSAAIVWWSDSTRFTSRSGRADRTTRHTRVPMSTLASRKTRPNTDPATMPTSSRCQPLAMYALGPLATAWTTTSHKKKKERKRSTIDSGWSRCFGSAMMMRVETAMAVITVGGYL